MSRRQTGPTNQYLADMFFPSFSKWILHGITDDDVQVKVAAAAVSTNLLENYFCKTPYSFGNFK